VRVEYNECSGREDDVGKPSLREDICNVSNHDAMNDEFLDENSDAHRTAIAFMAHCWGNDGTRFPGCQPVSIERKHFGVLKNNDYVVCEKTDGERYMFICFRNVCALVNRRMRVKPVRVSVNSRAFQGTVLDGELYEDKFMVYDALVVNGVTVGQEDFLSRLEHIEKFINTAIAMKSDTVRLHLKTFYAINDFDAFARERLPNVAEATDGVVFTPVNDEVRTGTHDFMFKWKPQAKNTVDFQMGFDAGSWRLFVQDKGKPVYECTIPPGRVEDESWFEDGAIVECEYVTDEIPMWWRPLKRRHDKTHPNNRRTLFRTIVNIKENIQLEEFSRLP